MSVETDVVAAFKEAMSHLAAGVVMVTNWVDEKPWGLTISACCSVSLEPPTLLVCPATRTATACAILEAGEFGVSLLGSNQVHAARFGAAPGAPKFIDRFSDATPAAVEVSRTPVVADALAHVDCVLTESLVSGDHVICVGEVRGVALATGRQPLVYFNRTFQTFAVAGADPERHLAGW